MLLIFDKITTVIKWSKWSEPITQLPGKFQSSIDTKKGCKL